MELNYSKKGEGPAIMLLHGWGGSITSLEKLQTLLADQGYQVFNFDLPGFGANSSLEKAMTLDDYVEFLSNFLKENQIFKPVLVGHSFGGKLAAAFASKHQDQLSKLVLINASGLNPRNSTKKKLMLIPAKVFGGFFSLPGINLAKPLARKLFYKFIVRERDYVSSNGLKETFLNVVNEHLDTRLVKIKAPTLLIWGEKDTYTPLWMGEKMAELIPNSRLEVVAEAKHILPKAAPEIVAKIIHAYLNSAVN